MNKDKIIKKSEDFTNIISNKQSVKNKYFSIYFIKSTNTKYGITVPKKTGHAVLRNKIKRQIKNIIYNNEKDIQINYNYVIIIKEAILKLDYQEIEAELINLIKKVR